MVCLCNNALMAFWLKPKPHKDRPSSVLRSDEFTPQWQERSFRCMLQCPFTTHNMPSQRYPCFSEWHRYKQLHWIPPEIHPSIPPKPVLLGRQEEKRNTLTCLFNYWVASSQGYRMWMKYLHIGEKFKSQLAMDRKVLYSSICDFMILIWWGDVSKFYL